MMRYSGIIYNDTAAAPGVCLTFFTQGCPHHCKGCHNPETWDYEGGQRFTNDVLEDIIRGLHANGVNRTLCIMGGEPLCDRNIFLTALLIQQVKIKYPNQKIYLWTGYTYEELVKRQDNKTKYVLSNIDCLIDGPFIEELRDTTLQMRGSSNQRIIYPKEIINGKH